MDFSKLAPRSSVPVPTVGEMPAGCAANVAEAERLLPVAERKFGEACDGVQRWVELDGKSEKSLRDEAKRFWQDQVYKHQSDRRHWLLMAQAWRKFVEAHPWSKGDPVGGRCAHGEIPPHCDVKPKMREPGDDDE